LTQEDVAILVGTHQSTIGALETGKQHPTVDQVCMFSLVFGRSFESLFAESLETGRAAILQNLPVLPAKRKRTAETFNRDSSLKRLAKRLSEEGARI
jgi:DNA-binding XRE family transcriptional regulator